MRPKHHVAVSILLAIAFYYASHNLNYSLLVFLVGVFVDIDHLFEFWFNKPRAWYSLKEFMTGTHFRRVGKIYILFHAWEYLFIWLAVWLILGWFEIGLAITIPYAIHLFMDQLGNDTCGPFYFLSYRIKTKFSIQKLCKGYN